MSTDKGIKIKPRSSEKKLKDSKNKVLNKLSSKKFILRSSISKQKNPKINFIEYKNLFSGITLEIRDNITLNQLKNMPEGIVVYKD